MSVFMLDTDSVTAVASTLDSLASQINSLSSSVSSYDTSCDEFNFSGAKSVIAANIEACATKVSNTSSALNSVVSSHTTLQNGLKFGAAAEEANANQNSNSQYSPASYSGGYSSGGYSGGSSSGSYYPTVTPPSPVVDNDGNNGNDNSTGTPITPPDVNAEPVDVNVDVTGIGHALVYTDAMNEIGKSLFENEALAYNAAGYATIGGMFIIACGTQFGKVGEVLEFTLKDGQIFKCIVGQNIDSNDGSIHFFVNDQWKEDGEENFQSEIGDYITKIQNFGSNREYTLGATVGTALDWAEEIANDNTHGYSQSSRWGNPNYDCSSFVISAYEAAGIPVKEAGASHTGNMRDAFVKCGFEWIPGPLDVNNLQPGDVLLDMDKHTEIYYGNGLMVGAHGDKDGLDGDSSGNEINISKYTNKNWDGVLRYVGTSKSNSTSNVTPPTAPRVQIPSTETTTEPVTDNSSSENTNVVEEEVPSAESVANPDVTVPAEEAVEV